MSPTFKIDGNMRYSIFSNEESRMHVHVYQGKKQAKVWLDPTVELADNKGFSIIELNKIIKTVKENENDFKAKYKAHIG